MRRRYFPRSCVRALVRSVIYYPRANPMTRPQRKRLCEEFCARAKGVRNFTERVSEGHEKGANVAAYTWAQVSPVFAQSVGGEPDISRDKVNSGERGAQEEDRTNHRSVETQCGIFYIRRKGVTRARACMSARAKLRRNAMLLNREDPLTTGVSNGKRFILFLYCLRVVSSLLSVKIV